MKRFITTLLAICAVSTSTVTSAMELQEGTDYQVVTSQIARDQNVYVYFSFRCGHCAALDETYAEVAGQLPEGVSLIKVPVFSPNDQLDLLYARGLAVAEQYNLTLKYTKTLFEHLRSGDVPASLTSLSSLAADEIDIEPLEFQKAYHSEKTTQLVKQYLSQSQALQINAVPAVIIGNQYHMMPKRVSSFNEYKELVKNLAVKNLSEQV